MGLREWSYKRFRGVCYYCSCAPCYKRPTQTAQTMSAEEEGKGVRGAASTKHKKKRIHAVSGLAWTAQGVPRQQRNGTDWLVVVVVPGEVYIARPRVERVVTVRSVHF